MWKAQVLKTEVYFHTHENARNITFLLILSQLIKRINYRFWLKKKFFQHLKIDKVNKKSIRNLASFIFPKTLHLSCRVCKMFDVLRTSKYKYLQKLNILLYHIHSIKYVWYNYFIICILVCMVYIYIIKYIPYW